MYINSLGHYLPATLLPNSYFLDVNGLTDEWIYSRTGIKTRSKVSNGENTNTMAIEAVKAASEKLSFDIKEVDLIVGASYSPYDTVVTIAHEVQHYFDIDGAKALYLSSACSSLLNALEVVQGYFALGKATKALVVASEHNTAYSHESDEKSGHLWGDGATAMFVTKEKLDGTLGEIIDIQTMGLGNIGKANESVYLHPKNDGLLMPMGKDVFIHACQYMSKVLVEILEKNNYTISDLDYMVPHQANMRIVKHIVHELQYPEEKVFNNISELGNTGCASTGIALSQNIDKIKKDDLVGFTVFGGGYSTGSMLVKF